MHSKHNRNLVKVKRELTFFKQNSVHNFLQLYNDFKVKSNQLFVKLVINCKIFLKLTDNYNSGKSKIQTNLTAGM